VKAYAWPHYVWTACGDFVLLAAYLLLLKFAIPPLWRATGRLAARGGSRPRSRVMDRLWNGPGWGHALLFAMAYLVLYELPGLPPLIYLGFVLERAHGETNFTALGFGWDILKTDLAGAVFVGAFSVGVFGLARRLAGWWWILGLVAGAGMFVSGVVDPYRSVLHFEQKPLPAGPLRQSLTELLARADAEYADIVVENTSKATPKVDMAWGGQGPTSRVILTDAFLEAFPPREVLAAVAHEAGHTHQSRWPGRVGAAAGVFLFMFLVHQLFALAARRRWLGIERYADIRTLPIIATGFFVLTSLATPISGYFAREREWDADRFAVRLTGDPEGLAEMLVRAARINKMDPDPPRWVVWCGMSHPPVGDRIAWARTQRTDRPN